MGETIKKMGKAQPSTFSVLGIRINAINMQQAIEQIHHWIENDAKKYVCVVPAHAVMSAYQDNELKQIYNNSDMCTPDGMSIVWILKMNGYHKINRVYGADLLLAACNYGLKYGWRHQFLGGTPETITALASNLRARFPGLIISGETCPPFRSLTKQEERDIITTVNANQSDILWVGLGSPRQEIWMNKNRGVINAPVMVGVGAAFDFLSGNKPQAPQWIQRIGMEWLFRLFNEPKRLWSRYRQYPKFIFLVLLQQFGLIHFPEE